MGKLNLFFKISMVIIFTFSGASLVNAQEKETVYDRKFYKKGEGLYKDYKFILALIDYERGKFYPALNRLRKAGRSNDVRKTAYNGAASFSYSTGQTIQGHIGANRMLVHMYENGIGTKPNQKRVDTYNKRIRISEWNEDPKTFRDRKSISNPIPISEMPEGGYQLQICSEDLNSDIIKAQFAGEVNVNLVQNCANAKRDLSAGDIFVYEYGYVNKKIKKENFCFGDDCLLEIDNPYLPRIRYQPDFVREDDKFDQYLSKLFNGYAPGSLTSFQDQEFLFHTVGGAYLKNSENENDKLVCFIWKQHPEYEKRRMLQNCYQRWLERGNPRMWSDKSWRITRGVEEYNLDNPEQMKEIFQKNKEEEKRLEEKLKQLKEMYEKG